MRNSPGKLITFEGGEGAGKSTQLQRLADFLRLSGVDVLTTREPGGSTGAESIRQLLVQGDTERWDGITEVLLHTAARRDHVVKTIWPALDRGAWVLCDRFVDSTVAYQGYGHGLPVDAIYTITEIALSNFGPDLTFVLDIPVDEGLGRARGRGGGEDRYERMGYSFHERLRQGFLAIARSEPNRCAIIDALNCADDVCSAIVSVILDRFRLTSE